MSDTPTKAPHDTVAQAITETDNAIARARMETQQRKLWSYVRSDTLFDWAKAHKEQGVRELVAVVDVLNLNAASSNENMTKLARMFCGRPEDTVVEVGHDAAVDKYMFAVWMGEDPKPTTEPQF